MSSWEVTPANVLSETGKTVTAEDVAMAGSSVGIYVNRLETDEIYNRDRYWIRMAIMWQAAWLVDQPDYTERQNVSTVSQDGVMIKYATSSALSGSGTGKEFAITLAPLAARALKNLSWKAGRSVDLAAQRVPPPGHPLNFMNEAHDGTGSWTT